MRLSGLPAVPENQYADNTVYDDVGEKIGNVDYLFVNGNRTPKYLGVQMTTLGVRRTLVPLCVVHVNERRQLIEILESKKMVKDAPTLEGDKKLTLAMEQQVQSFFGGVNG